MTILSSHDCILARQALGLSQNKVALATGINRSQLALFEVDKFIFDDNKLKTLKEFYQQRGYRFETPTPAAKTSPFTQSPPVNSTMKSPASVIAPRAVNGIVVSEKLDQETVDAAMTELLENDNALKVLGNKLADSSEWDIFDPKSEILEKVRLVLARNYILVCKLLGRALHTSITMENPRLNAKWFRKING